MLKELAKVQVDASELALMSSVAHLGTKNSNLQLAKRPLPEDLKQEIEKLNSIRGAKRRKKLPNNELVSVAVYMFSLCALAMQVRFCEPRAT